MELSRTCQTERELNIGRYKTNKIIRCLRCIQAWATCRFNLLSNYTWFSSSVHQPYVCSIRSLFDYL